MKRKVLLTVLILLQLILLAFLTPFMIKTEDENIKNNTIIAEHIFDKMNNCISKPITISASMANNAFLLKALRDESKISETIMEKQMADYLSGLQKTFGYTAVFVVSEKTRRYYSPNGIANIVNPLENPYDIWYQAFLDSGRSIDLDTDQDSVNNYRWTIFVNAKIIDEKGDLMGVCGVGVFIDDLIQIMEKEEKKHGIKINLIDTEGLVQVDSDTGNIETAYISAAINDRAGSETFKYTRKQNNAFRMTRYMPELEWYLVIQRFAMHEVKSEPETGLCVVVLYIFMILVLILILTERNELARHDLIKSQGTLDPLTGLPNRNYVRDSFGELGIFNTTRYKSLAVLDIDRFKIVNENRDGDEIIKGVVELSLKILNEEGLLFRWAGDEFVFFLSLECEEAEVFFKQLCKSIQEEIDVTVSVGLVTVDLADSIKSNYHRAVQCCYEMKAKGGNGVSKRL